MKKILSFHQSYRLSVDNLWLLVRISPLEPCNWRDFFPSECREYVLSLSLHITKCSCNGFQKEIMVCNYCHNQFLPYNLLIYNISTTEKFNQGNFSKVIFNIYFIIDTKVNNQFKVRTFCYLEYYYYHQIGHFTRGETKLTAPNLQIKASHFFYVQIRTVQQCYLIQAMS